MALSQSTARWVGSASLIFDFAAQQYGMLSKPNMKDIHDQNLSFFSPQPWFIVGFFAPQMCFNVAWLYRLWRLDSRKSEKERKEVEQIVDYVPYYAVGHICIGVWMFFWNSSKLKTANIFVVINTFTQLFYMSAKLPRMNTASTSSILTHIVSKTFAGIGVLDILHNTSIAYFKDLEAPFLVKILTGVGFGMGSFVSDWIFGGCLAYDLVALAVGQGGSWGTLLGFFAGGSAAITAVKNLINPPYHHKVEEYEEIPDEAV
ncbi:MAG: hypothetical protein M1831_004268 [Alyxoria varia]|nr:MAG: hypothetical protein M1831_004268 [Alyxoria varia]